MAKTLPQLINEEFGTPTRLDQDPEITSVGTSTLRLLRQDPNRLAFIFVNLSSNVVFLGPFSDVSSSKGFRAGPSGGSVSLHYKEDFHLVGQEWFVVADGASSALMTAAIVTT
tara:strand:- start:18 stop:356 length:339 start_codon:yes stop_codon:yes gene_type:complete